MKKQLFLLLLPILTLASCGQSTTSSDSKIDSIFSSSESTSSNSSISSSSEEKQYPNSVLTSKWGLEAAKASYDALGLAIPFIESDSFEYESGVDDFGDPDIWFYCYYKTDDEVNEAFNDYITICTNKGFSGEVQTARYVDYDTLTYFEFDVCYCDRVIKDATGTHEFGVELQFLVSYKNELPCLGIYGFTYIYSPSDQFPTEALDKVYGFIKHDYIPIIDNPNYEYKFQLDIYDNEPCLVVNIYDADYSIEEEYFNSLMATGKFVLAYSTELDDEAEYTDEYLGFDDQYYYLAMNKDIFIYFDYDLYNSVFVMEFYVNG